MSIVGPGAPYVSPAMLLNAPIGIDWTTIPDFGSTQAEQLAEATNLCQRATAAIDLYCETSLRATINTESVYGPGDNRCRINNDGTARLMLTRPPVVEVISATVQPRNVFPKTGGTAIPANMMQVEYPVVGIYGTSSPGPVAEAGNSIIIAPGYLNWWSGRMGTQFDVTYMNGYPHSSITQGYSVGVSSIHVDDVTGMLGAFCTFYTSDDALQESNTVTSVTPDTVGALSGPGTLGLLHPTVNVHQAGELFTTLPATIQQAAIQIAGSFALLRGSLATTVQTMNGSWVDANPPNKSNSGYGMLMSARDFLCHYRRTW